LEGVVVPKGTNVAIQIYGNNHNPHYWENPHEFNPDRFLPENSEGRDPYCYVPFSAGYIFIFIF